MVLGFSACGKPERMMMRFWSVGGNFVSCSKKEWRNKVEEVEGGGGRGEMRGPAERAAYMQSSSSFLPYLSLHPSSPFTLLLFLPLCLQPWG